ncbi:hypothetical protein D1872_130230 [compost metagenome]
MDILVLKAGSVSVNSLSKRELIISNSRRLGLNTLIVPISLVPTGINAAEFRVDEVTFTNATYLTQEAQKYGMKVIIEPRIVSNSDLKPETYNPTNVIDFFEYYKNFIRRVCVELAYPQQIYGIGIGYCLSKLEQYQDAWKEVAKFAREQYPPGFFTYTYAPWQPVADGTTNEEYESKLHNPVNGDLDFISISGFFALTQVEDPSLRDIKNSIYEVTIDGKDQYLYQDFKRFYEEWEKPVFISPLGFPDKSRAAAMPWDPQEWDYPTDTLQQANCFSAYREVFENEDWITGFGIYGFADEHSTYYVVGNLAEKVVYALYGDLYPAQGLETSMGMQIYSRLPNIYKRKDAEQQPIAYPLKRFFQVASVGMDWLRDRITGRENMFNIAKTPKEFLPYLYETIGFPFPSFLSEEDQRAFLKILPILYQLKGNAKVFEYLGRVFYGNDTQINPVKREGDNIYIDLNVLANGGLTEIDKRTERFLYFANFFRPVNRKLHVIVTLFYSDEYRIQAQDISMPDLITENGDEVFDPTKITDDEAAAQVEFFDEETFAPNYSDDHFDEIIFVEADTDVFAKTMEDSDSEDEIIIPQNRLGKAKLGEFKLGGN